MPDAVAEAGVDAVARQTSRRWCWTRTAAVTTLAAADTARSSDTSVCAARRTSSTTVVRSCHGISSWRTISSSLPGRRPPVHPAQVVTDHVLPQRVELVALAAELRWCTAGAERVAVAAAGRRRDRVDARVHGQLEPGRAGSPVAGEAERVLDLQRVERPDGDDAATSVGRR